MLDEVVYPVDEEDETDYDREAEEYEEEESEYNPDGEGYNDDSEEYLDDEDEDYEDDEEYLDDEDEDYEDDSDEMDYDMGEEEPEYSPFSKIVPDDVTATDFELRTEYARHGIRGVFRLGVAKAFEKAEEESNPCTVCTHIYYGVNGKAPVYSKNGINVYRLGYYHNQTYVEIENTNSKAYAVSIDFNLAGSNLMFVKVPHNGMVLEALPGVNIKDFTVNADASKPYKAYGDAKFLNMPLDKILQIGKVSIQQAKGLNTKVMALIPVKNVSNWDIAVRGNFYGIFLDEKGNVINIDMFNNGDVCLDKTLAKGGTGTIACEFKNGIPYATKVKKIVVMMSGYIERA